LKNVQPSYTPLPFNTLSQGTLSTSILNRPKSALQKSMVVILLTPLFTEDRELYHFMVGRTADRGSQILHSPSHSQAYHRTAQPVKDPSTLAQSSTDIRRQQEEPKLWIQVNGHPVWVPPRAVPGECQSQCRGVKSIQMNQQKQLWSIFLHGCCLGVWDILWDAGEDHSEIAQDTLWDVSGGNLR